mmetsp:Transcript_47747/g.83571  ORF Transcript_47747/g.83571 Transcript_47747/m.83571 type:complete len:201 (-) Transcript_47747:369-971(-)
MQHRVKAKLSQSHIGGHHHHPSGEGVDGLHASDHPGTIFSVRRSIAVRARNEHRSPLLGGLAMPGVHVLGELRNVLVGIKRGAAAGLHVVHVLAVADVLLVSETCPSRLEPTSLAGQDLQRLAIVLELAGHLNHGEALVQREGDFNLFVFIVSVAIGHRFLGSGLVMRTKTSKHTDFKAFTNTFLAILMGRFGNVLGGCP